MGSGKTSVGKRVAASLGFRFVDTDQLVVNLAGGKNIPEIFEAQGEVAFRDLETQALKEAVSGESAVISTGGGIVTVPRNRELLRDAGFKIWLKATPEIIYRRVSKNRDRPLLNNPNPMQTIRDLLSQREDAYKETADFSVDTSTLHPDEIVHGICETARVYFSGA